MSGIDDIAASNVEAINLLKSARWDCFDGHIDEAMKKMARAQYALEDLQIK